MLYNNEREGLYGTVKYQITVTDNMVWGLGCNSLSVLKYALQDY